MPRNNQYDQLLIRIAMKYLFVCYSFVMGFLHADVYGQDAIEISGTIRSKQGAVQGAQVQFYDLNNEFQGNCISGTSGTFTSEKRITIGKTIKIKIIASGYQDVQKEIKITKREIGNFMLERKHLIITGFVKDSLSEEALMGVEISFYDEQGRLIHDRSTNSLGYYEVETDFLYGQTITLRATKKDYYDDKELTHTFTSDGINRMPDIKLPGKGTRGLRAYIQVEDNKTGSPVGGGVLRYFDVRKSTYIEIPVPANGLVELKLFQPPGSELLFQVSKPRYRTLQFKKILSGDPLNNVFTCSMLRGN